MAWQAETTENTQRIFTADPPSPRLWRGKPTQSQGTRSLDRIYRMPRIGCKDPWKLRYAGIPRLCLGNNGKPRSTKISSLILVLMGSHFFKRSNHASFLNISVICVICGSKSASRRYFSKNHTPVRRSLSSRLLFGHFKSLRSC